MNHVNKSSASNEEWLSRNNALASPLHLVILIEAVTHGNGYRADSSIAAEYAEELCRLGAIEARPPYYVATDIGRLWLNTILKTPCPHLPEIDHG